jgi:hypothetical protein
MGTIPSQSQQETLRIVHPLKCRLAAKHPEESPMPGSFF